MFSNLKIRVRIGLGYGVAVLVLLAVGTVSYVTFQQADAQWKNFKTNEIAKKDLLVDGNRVLGDTIHHFKNYLLRGGEYDKNFSSDIAGIKRVTGAYRAIPEMAKEEHAMLDEIDRAADAYVLDMDKLVKLRAEGVSIEKMDKAVKGMDRPIYAAFVRLHVLVDRDVADAAEQFDELLNYARTLVGIMVLVAVMFSVAAALWLTASISRIITASTSQLSAASSEIAATVAQHERTASQQAAAANETSATITELSASSRQSAEQASNAAALAERSSAATAQGSDATHQAAAEMNGLKDKINAMADRILHLGEQTGQIGSIATLLKDLAGQINMLALNAAVEAARAGEHGKGFAVVAGEIRKLADQSKKSAEQTAVLATDIQKATNSSIIMTEDGTRTVNEVTQLVQKVADLFSSLSGMVVSVNENVQQVMLNARQQSAAFAQVVEATNSIAAGARETAAGISQTKIGVQSLNDAAEKLKAIA